MAKYTFADVVKLANQIIVHVPSKFSDDEASYIAINVARWRLERGLK